MQEAESRCDEDSGQHASGCREIAEDGWGREGMCSGDNRSREDGWSIISPVGVRQGDRLERKAVEQWGDKESQE